MVEGIRSTDRIEVDLEILPIDYNKQKKSALRKEIAEKYGIPERNVTVHYKPITVADDGSRVSLASDIVRSVQDPRHQKNMMKAYITANGYEGVDWDEIDAIDNQVNAFVDFDQYSRYRNYRFKYIKWSNYLSYGKDNYFDFTKLHGLVLLNSDPANQGGKTTFAIDLLRFALFGKADKSPNLASVFNSYLPEETEVCVEAGIEIDGDDYIIRRTVTRPALKRRTAKSKCTQKLEYFKKVGDSLEVIENCEGENVQQTNNIIRDAVGSVEDFDLVISATSYSLGELLRMGQTDKGRLFSRWLGLLSVEEKEQVAKKLWKDNYQKSLLSNTYDKETLKAESESLAETNMGRSARVVEATSEMEAADTRIAELDGRKNDMLASLRPVKEGLDSLDMNSLENQKTSLNRDLETARGELSAQKAQYMPVKDAEYDQAARCECLESIESLKSEKRAVELSNAELKAEIGALRKERQRITDLCAQGKCPTCGHVIADGEMDGQLADIKSSEDGLIAQGVANKARIDGIDAKISELLEKAGQFEKAVADATLKANLELKMTATHSNIENIKLKIAQIEATLADMATNADNIRYNGETRAKVGVVDASIKAERQVRDARLAEIEGLKKDMATDEKNIENKKSLINKLLEEEKVIRNWNLYLEMVGKNGIVKQVLRDALPIINSEVARILEGLCDFEVVLGVDDKNCVTISLLRDGVAMDLGTAASGFEGTMASLALRSALAGISSMSLPNALTLDEVLEGVAVTNYDNVRELYNRIVNNYDFILHITHNELLHDWHSQRITVTKRDNISSIVFSDKM